jgi:hypothetical protein
MHGGPPSAAVAAVYEDLLRQTHLSEPSHLAEIVAGQAPALGATDVEVLLVDHEQTVLVALARDAADPTELSIDGTVAGRAFRATSMVTTPGEAPGTQRLWAPLLDGTERVGVIGWTFPGDGIDDDLLTTCERYAHLIALLIVAKGAYGDTFEAQRRRRPMTIASELVWSLAPPLVFSTDDLVLAGLLEPAYDNGGDALDYAINDRRLHLAVFDAMGHGLAAAGVAAFAVAAYRHSRRNGCDLPQTHAAMHEAVGRQFPDRRFVTALIAELDLDTGRLAWISAGHPPPLLLRDTGQTRTLDARPAPPLGVDHSGEPPAPTEAVLEPGDRLLAYTDGLTEARGPDGAIFTLERLSRFIEREAAAGHTTPETLRRFRHAIIGRERAELRDDATALLVEWRGGGERRVMPQTVL